MALMQAFDCILLDTEFTAWAGSQQRKWSEPWEQREIIQIAALKVRIDARQTLILSEFNEIVKPSINPVLSEYIVELTGINQQLIDDMGVDFQSALKTFHGFCDNGKLPVYSWGHDGEILTENCQFQKVSMMHFAGGFYDLRHRAKSLALSGHHLSSGELAQHHNIDLTGHGHNALFDVKSLAATINYWAKTQQPIAELLNNLNHG